MDSLIDKSPLPESVMPDLREFERSAIAPLPPPTRALRLRFMAFYWLFISVMYAGIPSLFLFISLPGTSAYLGTLPLAAYCAYWWRRLRRERRILGDGPAGVAIITDVRENYSTKGPIATYSYRDQQGMWHHDITHRDLSHAVRQTPPNSAVRVFFDPTNPDRHLLEIGSCYALRDNPN
ncbi:MAG TPA: hypothetical protein VMV31_07375 [Terriglobales bacterium]|nr:hypothetical protein [Terriglobales bacterium]